MCKKITNNTKTKDIFIFNILILVCLKCFFTPSVSCLEQHWLSPYLSSQELVAVYLRNVSARKSLSHVWL